MADQSTIRDDELDRIEALLRDLDGAEIVDPPPDVWAAIDTELAAERAASALAVVPLAGRRRRAAWPLLAAAAAVVLVVVGVAAIAIRGSDDAQVLATAVLAYDSTSFDPAGADADATVELVERDGRYEIVITEARLPADLADADLELWLIEANADREPVDVAPVSLVDGPGTYRIPEGLDPDTHPIVDISIEPRDGNHEHSGRSILRGTLSA